MWFMRCLAGAGVTLLGFAAQAQSPEEFYKSTAMQIVVGHEPGTGFDLYARTLARHMPEHMPGKPSMVVQNMNGASGLTAFNWLYNVAPKARSSPPPRSPCPSSRCWATRPRGSTPRA
jgi:tripartite-type tricarboxylate transporter receptor subunit TctC